MSRRKTYVEPPLTGYDPVKAEGGTQRIMTEIRITPTYADIVEFRRVLYRQGLSPARFFEWIVERTSFQDPEVLKLFTRAREDVGQVTRFAEDQRRREATPTTAEELYSMIEMLQQEKTR